MTYEQAQTWARWFFNWYNTQHYHVGLNLHTPASVFYRRVDQVVAARQLVMDAAFAAHPKRFSVGRPMVKSPPTSVWINKPIDLPKPVVMSNNQAVLCEVSEPTFPVF